jgi:hemoglobin
MQRDEPTIYEMVGGEKTFENLVEVFYEKIEADEALRDVFPDDLEEGKLWQKLFLTQLFGGPTTYSEQRGHPRLRMRHQPFSINAETGQRWLTHMLASIDEVGIQEPARSAMRQYFMRAAPHMVNIYTTDDEEA